MKNTENSPFTNYTGVALIALAILGQFTMWFIPENFHGTFQEVAWVFGIGLTLVIGLSDDLVGIFLRALGALLKRVLGGSSSGKEVV